ncbi:MAG: hypothetical protein IPM29_04430 [Planctomycetes bacterium]|nr:hypothetical protein [Planctomycetota bacterium]
MLALFSLLVLAHAASPAEVSPQEPQGAPEERVIELRWETGKALKKWFQLSTATVVHRVDGAGVLGIWARADGCDLQVVCRNADSGATWMVQENGAACRLLESPAAFPLHIVVTARGEVGPGANLTIRSAYESASTRAQAEAIRAAIEQAIAAGIDTAEPAGWRSRVQGWANELEALEGSTSSIAVAQCREALGCIAASHAVDDVALDCWRANDRFLTAMLPPRHPELWGARFNAGVLLLGLGRPRDGIAALESALACDAPPGTAAAREVTRLYLARCEEQVGAVDRATELRQTALARLEQEVAAGELDAAPLQLVVTALPVVLGPGEGQTLVCMLIDRIDTARDHDFGATTIARLRALYGQGLLVAGSTRAAIVEFEASLARHSDAGSDGSAEATDVRRRLGLCLLAEGELIAAKHAFEECAAVSAETRAGELVGLLSELHLALVDERLGDHDSAYALARDVRGRTRLWLRAGTVTAADVTLLVDWLPAVGLPARERAEVLEAALTALRSSGHSLEHAVVTRLALEIVSLRCELGRHAEVLEFVEEFAGTSIAAPVACRLACHRARSLIALGRPADAATDLDRMLQASVGTLGAASAELLALRVGLAHALVALGREDRAASEVAEVRTRLQSLLLRDARAGIRTAIDLANEGLWEFEAARPLFDAALASARSLGDEDAIRGLLDAAARAATAAADHESAAAYRRQCLDRCAKLLAPDSPLLLDQQLELASCLVQLGRHTEAIGLVEAVRHRLPAMMLQDDPWFFRTGLLYGSCLLRTERCTQAYEISDAVHRRASESLPANDAIRIAAAWNLAWACVATARRERAGELFSEAFVALLPEQIARELPQFELVPDQHIDGRVLRFTDPPWSIAAPRAGSVWLRASGERVDPGDSIYFCVGPDGGSVHGVCMSRQRGVGTNRRRHADVVAEFLGLPDDHEGVEIELVPRPVPAGMPPRITRAYSIRLGMPGGPRAELDGIVIPFEDDTVLLVGVAGASGGSEFTEFARSLRYDNSWRTFFNLLMVWSILLVIGAALVNLLLHRPLVNGGALAFWFSIVFGIGRLAAAVTWHDDEAMGSILGQVALWATLMWILARWFRTRRRSRHAARTAPVLTYRLAPEHDPDGQ